MIHEMMTNEELLQWARRARREALKVGSEAAPTPAPLSQVCQAGNAEIATQHPLPNVAAALRDRKPLRILAIGAAGGRRGARGSYTGLIEKLLEQANKGLDVVIIERGVSGELAADAARRIRIEVALTDPSLVLWQIGTNDALGYVPLDEIEATVTETLRWLKEHKVDVVRWGCNSSVPWRRTRTTTRCASCCAGLPRRKTW